jgi:hypothetical protein
MPCTCDGYPDIPDYHKGPAADALCKVMKEHEARGEMGCFDAATLEWWEEHKRRDAEKAEYERQFAAREKARGDAMKKLTPEERRALGLDR